MGNGCGKAKSSTSNQAKLAEKKNSESQSNTSEKNKTINSVAVKKDEKHVHFSDTKQQPRPTFFQQSNYDRPINPNSNNKIKLAL